MSSADHPAPNPNQPDALVEKAQAEAEKRWTGDSPDGVAFRRIFVAGYLAAAAVLPEVERHAKAEGWDEGATTGYIYGREDEKMAHAHAVPTSNPYREKGDGR